MGLGFLGATIIPEELLAATKKLKKVEKRSLDFYNLHTEEKISVTYWVNGKYVPQALKKINFIMRDHRANKIKPIDTSLIDLLYEVKRGLKIKEPFRIISGYRSPETNEMLTQNSDGVAKQSYHLKGMAVDISFEGISIKKVRDYALKLEKGGVGYYPQSNFVHLDVGPVRFWG